MTYTHTQARSEEKCVGEELMSGEGSALVMLVEQQKVLNLELLASAFAQASCPQLS